MQQDRHPSRSFHPAWLSALLVLLVALGGCQAAPAAREFDPTDVAAAGNQAIEHGRSMQQLGARLVARGQALADQSWIGDGQHWIDDGTTMVAMGERTLTIGRSLSGNPIKAQEVNINQLRAQGLVLKSDGQALLEHGKVMIELSDLLRRRAEANGDASLARDVADSAASAQRMGQTGQLLVKGGQQLIELADTLARSIGR